MIEAPPGLGPGSPGDRGTSRNRTGLPPEQGPCPPSPAPPKLPAKHPRVLRVPVRTRGSSGGVGGGHGELRPDWGGVGDRCVSPPPQCQPGVTGRGAGHGEIAGTAGLISCNINQVSCASCSAPAGGGVQGGIRAPHPYHEVCGGAAWLSPSRGRMGGGAGSRGSFRSGRTIPPPLSSPGAKGWDPPPHFSITLTGGQLSPLPHPKPAGCHTDTPRVVQPRTGSCPHLRAFLEETR